MAAPSLIVSADSKSKVCCVPGCGGRIGGTCPGFQVAGDEVWGDLLRQHPAAGRTKAATDAYGEGKLHIHQKCALELRSTRPGTNSTRSTPSPLHLI